MTNFLDLLWIDLLIECSWNPREWTFFRTLIAANGSSSKSVSIGCTKVGSRDRYLVHERKHFFCNIVGGVDAFPISLDTQDIEQIITAGMALAPTFGGFCLSGIASPRSFTITDHLARAANIPVVHAEQDATPVAILSGLYNALKVVGKTKENVRAHLINEEMQLAAAERLASLVSENQLQEGQIIPQAMNYDVAPAVAAAVAQAAMDSGAARIRVDPQMVAQRCLDFVYEGLLTPVPALEEMR